MKKQPNLPRNLLYAKYKTGIMDTQTFVDTCWCYSVRYNLVCIDVG